MITSYPCEEIALHSHVESSLHLASCYFCVQYADEDLNDIIIVCHVPKLYVDFWEV